MKTKIIKNPEKTRRRILTATPTLGQVRMEWAAARWGQIIPCNWSNGHVQVGLNSCIPMNYLVAEGQNIAVEELITKDYEWLFLHEDDVILPPDAFIKLDRHMSKGDYPVISGLYYIKAEPSEPILYRGRGNRYYDKWKMGDEVMVDGVPTGCLLIHSSLLKIMYEESEEYKVMFPGIQRKVRRVFETPRKSWIDPETGRHAALTGTSDLHWCDRVINENVLKRAGWKKLAKKKYPFMVDTNIFCKHINLTTGQQFPLVKS
jgi:hypothetical protein